MKVPYNWLAEFIELPADAEAVAERLSLSGLEVAGVHRALPALDAFLVGEVKTVGAHPEADKLTVCQVDAGRGETIQIVCGAPNVRAGMKAPVILPGSQLPDGTKIREAKLRGVASAGMLCSAKELGLGDDHSGLLALPGDAAPGASVTDAMGGDEPVIEVEITPNRGDALSVLGVARDLAAVLDEPLRFREPEPVPSEMNDTFPVTLEAASDCPAFAGRVIRGVDPDAESPLWLRERLRRSGIRPVSAVVDVTQYVMLELGQPMHAYDLEALKGGITVRRARKGEKVLLLDGSEPGLEESDLVIADEARVLGLAGVMGGEGSGVKAGSRDIFLESAFFSPETVQGCARRLGLQTDASYRFERGVDPAGQVRAVERATALIQAVAGGRAGPIVDTREEARLPERARVTLTRRKLDGLLGIAVPDEAVTRILKRLQMPPEPVDGGWRVRAPSHRFDIAIEEDLVEEVGRIHGYDRIPAEQYPANRPMNPVPEAHVPLARLKQVLVERGFYEVITYSFVAEGLQRRLSHASGVALGNPITAEMTHMRASLWPGLVQALQFNVNRQRPRVRIFESGLRFVEQDTEIKQEAVLAGLVSGPRAPEQWGLPGEPATFADLRNDIEALLAPGNRVESLTAEPGEHPALHPGKSARLGLGPEPLGWMGAIHPELARDLEILPETMLFELALAPLQEAAVPRAEPISRFPAVRRDLAVVVPESVPAAEITAAIREAAGPDLRETVIFDVYRGKGLKTGTKSLAIGLILQKISRTLKDGEAETIVNRVVEALKESCAARLRE